MPDWFCKIDGKTYGPYPGEQLRRLADEGRLLPEDYVRAGTDGAWLPAEEMRDLFPEARRDERFERDEVDDEDDDGRPRRRRKSRKGANYFRVLWQNFQSGGQWLQLLGIAFGFEVLLSIVFRVIGGIVDWGRHPGLVLLVILADTALAAFWLAVAYFADVLVFGVMCLILNVRLDPRRDSVLDLFAYCYLIAVAPKLISYVVGLGSIQGAVLLTLLYPFFHLVLGYFLYKHWGLSSQRTMILAGARFGYQMLYLIGYVLYMFLWVRW